MSRRTRALTFLVLAAVCAALSATIANGYGSRVAQSFGPLREVVVANRFIPAGRPIGQVQVNRSLELRRVPARFVPPGALTIRAQALGRAPAAPIPVGSYLLAGQLRATDAARPPIGPRLAGGRRPVEIAVSGGNALLATGASPEGSRVDVVVTSQPQGAGIGRSYVAAAAVRLLGFSRQDPTSPGPASGWSATLALTRRQALTLIEAESFARSVRLLPLPSG